MPAEIQPIGKRIPLQNNSQLSNLCVAVSVPSGQVLRSAHQTVTNFRVMPSVTSVPSSKSLSQISDKDYNMVNSNPMMVRNTILQSATTDSSTMNNASIAWSNSPSDVSEMNDIDLDQDHPELTSSLRRKELFASRKQREFIPDNKKDENYWDRRRRNNEAAKRSREKRRLNDMVLETRVLELTKENNLLRAQLDSIKDRFGVIEDPIITQVSMPISPVSPGPETYTNNASIPITTICAPNGQSQCQVTSQQTPINTSINESENDNSSEISIINNSTSHNAIRLNDESKQQSSHLVAYSGLSLPTVVMPNNASMFQNSQVDYSMSPLNKSVGVLMTPENSNSNLLEQTDQSYQCISPKSTMYHANNNSNIIVHIKTEPPDRCCNMYSSISPVDFSMQNHQNVDYENHEHRDSLESDDHPNDYHNNICLDSIETRKSASSSPIDGNKERYLLPHKLRHKTRVNECNGQPQDLCMGNTTVIHENLDHNTSSTSPSLEEDLNNHIMQSMETDSDSDIVEVSKDVKYVDRRPRNNEAAKKCRASRRALYEYRYARSECLQNENNQLRSEMQKLATEVANLKDMLIKRKPRSRMNGYHYECHHDNSDSPGD